MIDRVDRHELDAGLRVNLRKGQLLEQALGGGMGPAVAVAVLGVYDTIENQSSYIVGEE